jgi:hypothetical protein
MKSRNLWWAEHVVRGPNNTYRVFMGKPLGKGAPGTLKGDMGG